MRGVIIFFHGNGCVATTLKPCPRRHFLRKCSHFWSAPSVMAAFRRKKPISAASNAPVHIPFRTASPFCFPNAPVMNKLIAHEAGVKGLFQQPSYTHQKEYCRWTTEAKKKRPANAGWPVPSKCSGARQSPRPILTHVPLP